MPWLKPKKKPATNNSNRAIEVKLDRIIELLEKEDKRNDPRLLMSDEAAWELRSKNRQREAKEPKS